MGQPINTNISQAKKYYNSELAQAFFDYANLIDRYDFCQQRADLQDTGYFDNAQKLRRCMDDLKEHLQKYNGINVELEYDPKGHYRKKLMSIKFDFSNWEGV